MNPQPYPGQCSRQYAPSYAPPSTPQESAFSDSAPAGAYPDYTESPDALGWNASIEAESEAPVLLPEGDYYARIIRVIKDRHTGSARIPPCNKAVLTFALAVPGRPPAKVVTTFFLIRTMEWKLGELFRGIGVKKPGEPVRMNWDLVEGSLCRVRIRHRKYEKDGETREVNDLERIYPYDPQDYADFAPIAEALGIGAEDLPDSALPLPWAEGGDAV